MCVSLSLSFSQPTGMTGKAAAGDSARAAGLGLAAEEGAGEAGLGLAAAAAAGGWLPLEAGRATSLSSAGSSCDNADNNVIRTSIKNGIET